VGKDYLLNIYKMNMDKANILCIENICGNGIIEKEQSKK
jgi:hypothetical protein